LGEVLARAESEEFIPLQAVTALRLLIFTGARHGEILQLRWDQVDPERKLLIFGAEQHKTGRKTGTKTLPLNGPAFELLRATPRVLGNPHVIPGLKPGSHFIGLQKCWERVRDKVDEIEAERVEKKERVPGEVVSIQDVRIHDLRHTFASVGVSHGLSLPVMGSLLGHSQPAMTQRYAHFSNDPRLEASEHVAEILVEALGQGIGAG
jgi:integrase